MIGRRKVVLLGTVAAVATVTARALRPAGPAYAAEQQFEVTHSDAEWRKLLTPAQYNILREQGTEPPFSSPSQGRVQLRRLRVAALFVGDEI
jgi:peptide-methionine (R)-S-oxide reductase